VSSALRAAAGGAALAVAVAAAGCGRDSIVYLGRDHGPQTVPAVDAPSAGSSGGSAGTTAFMLDAGTSPVVTPTIDAATAPPLSSCESGRADCDGDPANGCEADLQVSAEHCGACGVSCSQRGCVCEGGERVLRCPEGYLDCDLELDNGCELDVRSDPQHCGACDRACPSSGPNVSGARCEQSQCVLTCAPSVLAPFGDCDANPDNGCEARLWADRSNCGMCGTDCTFCEDGSCL